MIPSSSHMCITKKKTKGRRRNVFNSFHHGLIIFRAASVLPATVSLAARSPVDAFSVENPNINTRNEAPPPPVPMLPTCNAPWLKNARSEELGAMNKRKQKF